MIDLLYVGGTVAFFAMMIAFVAACAKLGAAPLEEAVAKEDQRS